MQIAQKNKSEHAPRLTAVTYMCCVCCLVD